MSSLARIMLLIYSIFVVAVMGTAFAVAIGRTEPLDYTALALASTQNRLIIGVVAVIAIAGVIFMLVVGLRREREPEAVIVDDGSLGQIVITIQAVKIIIMKAVRQVKGIKEVKPIVKNGSEGMQISLHVMINPEQSVPEMSREIQTVVSQHLKDIGGLDIPNIKVIVDDLGTTSKLAST